ncbi:sensor histidine kinase [Sphingomonas sp.]|uniref:sensor histidine kinase n=1 Tax=Sphingomonas sp. TaxID=28214 RepID=UPI002ED8179F
MRFDDSLKTVLSGETASGVGAQSAWRQLVDLIGRGRVPAEEPAIARLRILRQAVPDAVRAATARALAFASPPAALVGLFGEDALEIAAPVLRTATLDGDEWAAILPRLSPAGRSVLRHRRDLPDTAKRALEAFGATDFVLDHATPAVDDAVPAEPVVSIAPPATPLGETPFVTLGKVALGLPVVAEALRRVEVPANDPPRFEISDLVARIDAFNRERERPQAAPSYAPPPNVEDGFRFETDGAGIIGWVDGVVGTPLVGLCLAHAALQGEAQVDGVVAGAYRRRSPFRDARLVVGGTSDASGAWRLSGMPAFDPASGRFLGYRGTARRPRADESATPRRSHEAADSLRQLVHELRTPTNAIAGFAELIETELLGAVRDPYRGYAAAIRGQATALIQAIDDLDTAARIEGGALDLRPSIVPLRDLVSGVVADLQPLAALRGAVLMLHPDGASPDVDADDRALERLAARLLAALVGVAGRGEIVGVAIHAGEGAGLVIDRPVALAGRGDEALLSIDADREADDGEPLLGTGFALRLASNLAVELGGSLTIEPACLTLRLRAAVDRDMGQASIN